VGRFFLAVLILHFVYLICDQRFGCGLWRIKLIDISLRTHNNLFNYIIIRFNLTKICLQVDGTKLQSSHKTNTTWLHHLKMRFNKFWTQNLQTFTLYKSGSKSSQEWTTLSKFKWARINLCT
jgi:hypothetical protein